MRFQFSLCTIALGFLATACQHPLAPKPDRELNNPYKYDKRSALCEVTPIAKDQSGQFKTTMKVRSDDGQCEFTTELINPNIAYASFGISTMPEHGKAFIYNYDNRTYIRYTPTVAYAGNDQFVANLISSNGAPKTLLTVDVSVDNTGVSVPKPVVVEKPQPTAPSKTKKVRKHRRVNSKVKKQVSH